MTSSYASSMRTVTDAAGNTFGVWNENGLLQMAQWNEQAGRWSEAARISDAINGQNVQLVAANLPKDKSDRTTPVLVASWESGSGNEADVYMALGFYQNNGEIQWSDSVRLAVPNQQERKHKLGTATVNGTDYLLIASESQLLADPDGAVGIDRSGSAYNDSEISTLRVQVVPAARSNGQTVYTTGATVTPQLASASQEVVAASVNGREIEIGKQTDLAGLGVITINRDGSTVFNRKAENGELTSELLITADLVNKNASTLTRTSHTILTQKLLDAQSEQETSINGYYQLRITNNGSLQYSTAPVTFYKTDSREQITRSTFTAALPRSSSLSLRNYTGNSPLSDTSLRGLALKASETIRSSALVNAQSNPYTPGS